MPRKANKNYKLGRQYYKGKNVQQDYNKAAKFIGLAAMNGHKKAQFWMGYLYSNDLGVKQNKVRAANFYKLAADQGHVKAQYNLARMYDEGDGIPENTKEAFHYYQLAANAQRGLSKAQFHLAQMYYYGDGTDKDSEQAFNYYQLAANQNSTKAHYHLAQLYDNGYGTEQNLKQAFHHYKIAADNEHMEAQYYVAKFYHYGEGIDQDINEAIRYYKKAADQGNVNAEYDLFLIYEDVENDTTKAFTSLKSAADKKHIDAQYALAQWYENGNKVEKNLKEAARYYQYAADENDAQAQFALSKMYEEGRGVPQDKERALKYLKLAAKQNLKQAQYYLHLKFAIGHGVKQDLEKAQHWHHLATTVKEKNAFRLFAAQRLAQNLIKAPSLLLNIHERTESTESKQDITISKKGLYKFILSSDVELSKSYLPANPPKSEDQRGPTCGLTALKVGISWGHPDCIIPPVRKNLIKTTKEKKVKNKHADSIRKIAKTYGSVVGEAHDINMLAMTANNLPCLKHGKYCDFGCQVIKMNTEAEQKTYVEKICEAIRAGHSVILPVDAYGGFPGEKKGKGTHYALAWGYLYKNNQYHLIVTHASEHYLWSENALQKSHEQLPIDNPLRGEYYKDYEQDDYILNEKNKAIVDKKDLREITHADLNNFKFTALTIPTQEKNLLVLDENKNQGTQPIFDAVKNSDAITLKLLLEKNNDLSAEEILQLEKISQEKNDTFSLNLLQQIKENNFLSLHANSPSSLSDRSNKS